MPAPAERLVDLTIPSTGSTTGARLFALALGRLTREMIALGKAAPADEESQRFAREIERLQRDEPGALPALLRSPPIATLLRCVRTTREPAARAAFEKEIAALFFFELALRNALLEPATRTTLPRVLGSPSMRAAVRVPEGATAATFSSGRVVFAFEAGAARSPDEVVVDLATPNEHFYTDVAPAIALATYDANPLSLEEKHPDKEGNAVDLGGRAEAEWSASLGAALDLIGAHLPEQRRELDLYAQQIVPVGFDAEKHLSASYAEAIGTVYVSLHPDLFTMAEALIHEASHGKLNALFELDDVLENAFAPLYTSPVRPDPRPLHGVLLAVHAFLPIARLYERMIAANDPRVDARLRDRYARVCRINAEGADVLLRHARPTTRGRVLLAEIRRWIEHYAASC